MRIWARSRGARPPAPAAASSQTRLSVHWLRSSQYVVMARAWRASSSGRGSSRLHTSPGAEVVLVDGEASHPDFLVGPLQPGLRHFGEGEEVVTVATAGVPLFAGRRQRFPRRRPERSPAADSGARPPRRRPPRGSGRPIPPAAPRRQPGRWPAGLRDRTPREHREVAQEGPLLVAQEVVAPVDRRLQRGVTSHRRTRAVGQQLEAGLQAGGDLADGQGPGAGGGQLDAQGKPVQTAADVEHQLLVAGTQRPVRADRLRPVREQTAGVGIGHGRNRPGELAVDGQRLPARRARSRATATTPAARPPPGQHRRRRARSYPARRALGGRSR